MDVTSSDWQELLARYPALASIPATLRYQAEHHEFSAGTSLCRIGDRVKHIFLVIRGEVRLIRYGRNGGEIILQRVHRGFLAEASLFSNIYHCDLLTAKDGALLRFPAESFREALDGDAAFRENWMIHFARELRQLRTQNERLSLHSAADRIIHYIESEGAEGSITLMQSRKAWASELGLTHEALYRALRRLQDDGTLRIEDNWISITGS